MTSLTRSFCWHSGCEIAATIWSVGSRDLDLEEICIWMRHEWHILVWKLLLHSLHLPEFEVDSLWAVFWTHICNGTLADGLAGYTRITCDIVFIVSFFFFFLSYKYLSFLQGRPIFYSNLGLTFEASFGNWIFGANWGESRILINKISFLYLIVFSCPADCNFLCISFVQKTIQNAVHDSIRVHGRVFYRQVAQAALWWHQLYSQQRSLVLHPLVSCNATMDLRKWTRGILEMIPFTDPEYIPATWSPSPTTACDQHLETTQFSGY